MFLDYYFGNGFNGQAAARDAGYCAPYNTSAWRIMHMPAVQKELERRLDAEGLTAERIVGDIAQIAMGSDLADFVGPIESGVSLEELRDRGVDTRLLKSFRRTTTKDGGSVHFEIQDRLKALEGLAKIRGLIDAGGQAAPAPLVVQVDLVEAVRAMIDGITAAVPPGQGFFSVPLGRPVMELPAAEVVDVEVEVEDKENERCSDT